MFNIAELFGEYCNIFEFEFYQFVDYVFATVKSIKNSINSYSINFNSSNYYPTSSSGTTGTVTSKFNLFAFENFIVFSELQKFLLKLFFIVLLVNLVLIKIYWRKYGKIITERFIRPSKYLRVVKRKINIQ